MTTLNLAIASNAGNAWQESNGDVSSPSSFLLVDSTSEWAGFRFLSVTIPAGATIDDAIFTITPSGTGNDEPLHTLWGEDVDNAAAFTTGSANFNLSTRTRTSASDAWSATDLGASSTDVEWGSPNGNPTSGHDLSPIIQEIVDRGGWASGNAIVLLFTQTSLDANRDLGPRTYQGGNPARLDIDYTAASGSTGSGSPSLPALSSTGSGIHEQTGSGTPTLPSLSAAGTGAMQPSGAAATNLPSLSASGAGVHGQTASGAPTLPSLTASGDSLHGQTSTGSPTLPALQASGDGTHPYTGTGAPTLPALTAAGEGERITQDSEGSGAPTLPQLASNGVGYMQPNGTGTPTLPGLQAASQGVHEQTGSGAPSLPSLTAASTGTHAQSASGSPTLPALTSTGSGLHGQTGSGAPSLPGLNASGAGLHAVNPTGAAIVVLGQLVMLASGFTPVTGAGACTLRMLTCSGRAQPIIRTGYYMRDIRRGYTRRVRPAI